MDFAACMHILMGTCAAVRKASGRSQVVSKRIGMGRPDRVAHDASPNAVVVTRSRSGPQRFQV